MAHIKFALHVQEYAFSIPYLYPLPDIPGEIQPLYKTETCDPEIAGSCSKNRWTYTPDSHFQINKKTRFSKICREKARVWGCKREDYS